MKKRSMSGNAREPAPSRAEVPLLAPALAVLASATIAVSVLALFAAPDRAPDLAPDIPVAENIVSAPAMAAWAFARLSTEAPAEAAPRLNENSDHDGAPDDASLGSTNFRPLREREGRSGAPATLARGTATGGGEQDEIFQYVSANYIVPVSFEVPADVAPRASLLVEINTKLGGNEFLPAPVKPSRKGESASLAAIQLPPPKLPRSKPSGKTPPEAMPLNSMARDGRIGSVAALDAHFERIEYDLANVRDSGNDVPRLFLMQLPADIADVSSVATRKRIFIKAILPVVLRVNEDILAARERLQKLRAILDAGFSLTGEQRQWLYEMADRYETDPYDWDAFMARVDIVPPSLAIAQAAEESGWGTSRFAREGNALFGQYTYKISNGILPEERASGRRHRIRAYSSLVEGVRSYIHNLNYHRAYGEFRAARKWLRARAKPIDGYTLAGELLRYSERGADYVKTIRRIIRANDLSPLDAARLNGDRWTQDDHAAPGRQS